MAPATHGSAGGRYKSDRLRDALKRARLAAGVPQGSLHAFRHAFCSFLANKGVPAMKVMRMMGHSSLDIINTYYHTNDAELLRSVANLDAMFGAESDDNDTTNLANS